MIDSNKEERWGLQTTSGRISEQDKDRCGRRTRLKHLLRKVDITGVTQI